MLGKKTVRRLQRVPLGLERRPRSRRRPARDPLRAEAERLDGARALDGLRERRGDLGVRRRLGEVAVLGAGEVPPQPDHERRQREQARQRTHQPTLSAAAKVSTAETTAIVHSGSAQRTDQPSWSMSRPGAGQQVAGPGRLDRADRAAPACWRRSPRAARRAPARPSPASGSGRSGSAPSAAPGRPPATSRSRSTWRAVVPFSTACDQAAEQARRGQRGQRGQHVQAERRPEQPRVPARDPRDVAAYRRCRRRRAAGCSRSSGPPRLARPRRDDDRR